MKKIDNKSEYFWNNVVKTKDCWIYTGSRGTNGYGRIQTRLPNGKRLSVFAHRYAYELANRVLCGDKKVCHHCDNPSCVRPSHLFLGTQGENMKDASAKDRISFGEKHWNRKLTTEKVRRIKTLAKIGVSTSELGNKFGVSRQSVADIVYGRTWTRI